MDQPKRDEVLLYSDPEASLQEIRDNHRKFLAVGAPLYRALGLAGLTLTLGLYLTIIGDPSLWPKTWRFLIAAGSYAAFAGLLQNWFYSRYKHAWLYFCFMTTDVALYLLAIYLTGGNESWLVFVLLGRIADQTYLGYKRSLIFSHVTVLGYGLLVVYLAKFEDKSIDWPLEWAKIVALYGMNLYISLTAIPSQRIRHKMRTALHTGQRLLQALREKSRQLRREKERAEHQSQIKGQFLANMSHEIRTPINGILGLNQLLMHTNLDEEQRDYLQSVQFSTEALLGIIDDILDFSRLDAGRVRLENQPFSLSHTLNGVLQITAFEAYAKGLDLWPYLDPNIPDRVMGDPLRLRQVFMNLVGNAVKFTEAGQVEVTCRVLTRQSLNQPDASWPAQFLNEHGDFLATIVESAPMAVLVRIDDTGPGIQDDQLEDIFQRFSQGDNSTTRRHGGTGLGLAIARELVTLMGGQLAATSVVGRGSTFWFALPFQLPESGPAAATPPATKWPGRALVLELSGARDGHLARFLAQYGIACEQAADIRQATTLLEGISHLFLHCPSLDRLDDDLHTWLKDLPASVHVVAVIPPTEPDLWHDRLRRLGLHRLLKKPIRAGALEALMQQAAAPAVVTAGTRRLRPNSMQGMRILIAEDNPLNRRIMEKLLQAAGAATHSVANGAGVLTALDRERFDAILMDVHMPEMDGIETCRRIREQERGSARHLPIIAVTASVMESERRRILEAGMDDFLAKPVNFEELADSLTRLLAR